MKKYNFGCGDNKIDGFINVDINPDFKPDVVMDFLKPLPIESKSVSEIVLYHVIEHIPESKHLKLLLEFHRILKENGTLVISYPEFSKISQNWIDNKQGLRDFWKATIYGRQTTPYDIHVSLMNTPDFVKLLKECGFRCDITRPEIREKYNTIIYSYKSEIQLSYEDIIKKEIFENDSKHIEGEIKCRPW